MGLTQNTKININVFKTVVRNQMDKKHLQDQSLDIKFILNK